MHCVPTSSLIVKGLHCDFNTFCSLIAHQTRQSEVTSQSDKCTSENIVAAISAATAAVVCTLITAVLARICFEAEEETVREQC